MVSDIKVWKLIFQTDNSENTDPEEIGCELIELGFGGVEFPEDNTLICYHETAPAELEQIIAEAVKLNLTLLEKTALEQTNWIQKCQETLEPLQAGNVFINPVISPESEPLHQAPADSLEIRIMPGTGFGTGHHPSTATLIEFLQHKSLKDAPPATGLDFGTGSGILAIVCSKLYKTEFLAIDNDSAALGNAETNIQINDMSDLIELKLSSIEEAPNTEHHIVCANIYAEVLCQYEKEIRTRVKPGGFLLLAGVMESKIKMLKSGYSTGWDFLEEKCTGGWFAALLRKN